jgi:hypothetical protein
MGQYNVTNILTNSRLTIIEVPEEHYITAGGIGVRLGVGSPAADISGELPRKANEKYTHNPVTSSA